MAASDRLHLFGIRHHGPGSAHRLERALDAVRPSIVLIEGPADASDLLPLAAHADMVPPVALLCYPTDAPEEAGFWPMARFSPEYRAVLWAVANGAEPRFIDLPATARWDDEEAPGADDGEGEADAAEGSTNGEGEANDAASEPATDEARSDDPSLSSPAAPGATTEPEPPIVRDPIGALAHAAGYEDGEGWWNDVLERSTDDEPEAAFRAVADAMAALREAEPMPHDERRQRREDRREAHMRLAVAAALKETGGPVAVVCGAWHVPALQAKVSGKDDRATLKGMRKRKLAATWAPWTSPRLATGSGYGAGVTAPGWYAHLWDVRERADGPSVWLARTARALRAKGHSASTASLIEAERLGTTLAAIRLKPAPGFEELRDATVACLCVGQPARLMAMESELLIGTEVGEIPDAVPLAPLLEDLKRQQKAVRLKPEALERELALDLRSESGLARSTLLHRLVALGVPWGELGDAGRSRGTFRERWVVAWEPEYAVRLVERLVHGPTIERAAASMLAGEAREVATLTAAANVVSRAITADLPAAVAAGMAALDERAAHGSDCLDTLHALPPLAGVVRYGEARRTEAADALPVLLDGLIVRAAIALPLASRDLENEAAAEMAGALGAADGAARLVEPDEAVAEAWREGLATLARDSRVDPRVAGKAAQLLYGAGEMDADEAASLLSRHLSPGTETAYAAAFFEGFLAGAGARLVHDAPLRAAVDAWLTGLDEEAFTEALPLFRRVFSDLDAMERRRLVDAAMGGAERGEAAWTVPPGAAAIWDAHLADLAALFGEGRLLFGERT